MINTLFVTTEVVEPTLLLSFSTHKHMSVASCTSLSNFFEEKCPQSHPQYLSGLLRTLFLTTFLEIAVYNEHISRTCLHSTNPRVLSNLTTSPGLAAYFCQGSHGFLLQISLRWCDNRYAERINHNWRYTTPAQVVKSHSTTILFRLHSPGQSYRYNPLSLKNDQYQKQYPCKNKRKSCKHL